MNYPHSKSVCSGEAAALRAGEGREPRHVSAPAWDMLPSQPAPARIDPRPARRMMPVNAELWANSTSPNLNHK